MKYYEVTYLISPDFTQEEAKNFQEKINSLIEKEGGILPKQSEILKKKLSFPIKKRELAYLANVGFYLNPEKLGVLEKKLKQEGKIIRYLILAKKVSKKIPEISPKPLVKPKKVELKEIEKKLEEILGE